MNRLLRHVSQAPARPPVAGPARLGPALRRRGPGPRDRAVARMAAAVPPPAQLRRVSRGDRRLVDLVRAPGPAAPLPPAARGAGHGGRAHARPALGLGGGRNGPALPAQAPLRRPHGDRHRGLRRAEVLRRRLPRALPRPLDAPRLAAARPGLDRRHRPTRPALAPPGHLRRPRGRGARRRPRHRPRPRRRPRAPLARPHRRALVRLLAGEERAALPAHGRRARRLLPTGTGRPASPRSCSTSPAGSCARSRPGSSCGSSASTFPCPRPW